MCMIVENFIKYYISVTEILNFLNYLLLNVEICPFPDIIIIIRRSRRRIFINCNWVITWWQWLFYMYTNMGGEVTREFKSGGLHESHVVATWKLGNHLSIRL